MDSWIISRIFRFLIIMILNRFGQQAIESLLILLKFPIESSNTCTLVLIKHVFNVIKGEDLTSGKFQKQQVLVFQFYRGPLSAITLKRYKKFYIKRYFNTSPEEIWVLWVVSTRGDLTVGPSIETM